MAGQVATALRVPRLGKKGIKDLARRIVQGDVFITNSEEGITCAFGMVFLMEISEADAKQIGALWEAMSARLNVGVNGYPTFASWNYLHIDDLAPLDAQVRAFKKALA